MCSWGCVSRWLASRRHAGPAVRVGGRGGFEATLRAASNGGFSTRLTVGAGANSAAGSTVYADRGAPIMGPRSPRRALAQGPLKAPATIGVTRDRTRRPRAEACRAGQRTTGARVAFLCPRGRARRRAGPAPRLAGVNPPLLSPFSRLCSRGFFFRSLSSGGPVSSLPTLPHLTTPTGESRRRPRSRSGSPPTFARSVQLQQKPTLGCDCEFVVADNSYSFLTKWFCESARAAAAAR
jgi:hypothetical protein